MANQPNEVEDRPVQDTADIASDNDEQPEKLANDELTLFIVKWCEDHWALGLERRGVGVLLRPSGGSGMTQRLFRTGLERNVDAELVLVDQVPTKRLSVLLAHIRQVLRTKTLMQCNSVTRVLAVIGRLTSMGIVAGRIYETIAQEYMLPDDFEEEVSEPLSVEPKELLLPWLRAIASMFDDEEEVDTEEEVSGVGQPAERIE